jgi:hypothetical protein
MIANLGNEELLKIPLDRRGFLRRECPSCHRQFKLRWSARDALLVQRRLGKLLVHANDHELLRGFTLRRCPYCAFQADADDWWTEEQRQLLSRRAAALGEEIRYEQLRHVERSGVHGAGATFVAVPPDPFSFKPRAEPDDMRVVPLLCCSEDVKVRESWENRLACPFCGIEHDLRRTP